MSFSFWLLYPIFLLLSTILAFSSIRYYIIILHFIIFHGFELYYELSFHCPFIIISGPVFITQQVTTPAITLSGHIVCYLSVNWSLSLFIISLFFIQLYRTFIISSYINNWSLTIGYVRSLLILSSAFTPPPLIVFLHISSESLVISDISTILRILYFQAFLVYVRFSIVFFLFFGPYYSDIDWVCPLSIFHIFIVRHWHADHYSFSLFSLIISFFVRPSISFLLHYYFFGYFHSISYFHYHFLHIVFTRSFTSILFSLSFRISFIHFLHSSFLRRDQAFEPLSFSIFSSIVTDAFTIISLSIFFNNIILFLHYSPTTLLVFLIVFIF